MREVRCRGAGFGAPRKWVWEIIEMIWGDFACCRVEQVLMQVGDQLASCSNSLDNIQVEKEDQRTVGRPDII